jgi:hypothetical protein
MFPLVARVTMSIVPSRRLAIGAQLCPLPQPDEAALNGAEGRQHLLAVQVQSLFGPKSS